MFFKRPSNSNGDKSISFAEVFAHELEVIAGARKKRQVPHRPRPLNSDIVGLSFSGGGIRSATFNLGVNENLGMYELVRRRCRVIIASDAGADPDRVCNDLAAAIEKCRVDFGAQITINIEAIRPVVSSLPGDQGLLLSKAPFVIGKIRYPDDREGTLIYLKPSLNADLPQDVLAYARLAQSFPHQSTIDQFFDEAQFESYRALGFACASAAIDAITNAVRT